MLSSALHLSARSRRSLALVVVLVLFGSFLPAASAVGAQTPAPSAPSPDETTALLIDAQPSNRVPPPSERVGQPRLFGGSSVPIEDHPWVVYVERFDGVDFFSCTGVILRPDTVLTAAHCTEPGDATYVYAGFDFIGAVAVQNSEVSGFQDHPSYQNVIEGFDVSVLTLQDPLVLTSRVQPIQMATSADLAGASQATIAGWGSQVADGPGATFLQAASVPFVNKTTCAEQIIVGAVQQGLVPAGTRAPVITPEQLCAGSAGSDTCKGDSGGPIIIDHPANPKLVGLTSWGIDCGLGIPGVYANTTAASMTTFITSQIGALCAGFAVTINSSGGTINGTTGADVILGSSSNDTINGRGGDDLICGLGGNDTIFGNGGNDTMYGAGGNDQLFGGEGNDVIRGGDGKDRARGQNGNDQLFGQAGNDNLNGNNGDDLVSGGDGHDYVSGRDGKDVVTGGRGNDTINGGGKQDLLKGGAGDDIMNGNAFADDMFGGTGNDTMKGGDGPDHLRGEQGNDNLDGSRGNDTLWGGSGSDACNGRTGFDVEQSCETTQNIP